MLNNNKGILKFKSHWLMHLLRYVSIVNIVLWLNWQVHMYSELELMAPTYNPMPNICTYSYYSSWMKCCGCSCFYCCSCIKLCNKHGNVLQKQSMRYLSTLLYAGMQFDMLVVFFAFFSLHFIFSSSASERYSERKYKNKRKCCIFIAFVPRTHTLNNGNSKIILSIDGKKTTATTDCH